MTEIDTNGRIASADRLADELRSIAADLEDAEGAHEYDLTIRPTNG